jgi:hypothetical protein
MTMIYSHVLNCTLAGVDDLTEGFVMEQPFLDHPGQLLPMQIKGDEEWDFCVATEVNLYLPPYTCKGNI